LLVLLADTLEQRSYNVVEVAYLIRNLRDTFNYTNKELSNLLKQSTSQVSNILQLLNLPKEILKDVVNNKLSYGHAKAINGHAKAISRLENDKAILIRNEILKNKLSVRQTELLVNNLNYKNKNFKINIINNKIIIEFKNQEELNKFYNKIINYFNS